MEDSKSVAPLFQAPHLSVRELLSYQLRIGVFAT